MKNYLLILCCLCWWSCKNNNPIKENTLVKNVPTEEQRTVIENIKAIESQSDIAYLKKYDGQTFESLEEVERDLKERMVQLSSKEGEDIYIDITAPLNASLATCTLVEENTLAAEGEIFHDGFPYQSIVVFDLKNDNIVMGLYESDTETVKSFIEKEEVGLPKTFTEWLEGK